MPAVPVVFADALSQTSPAVSLGLLEFPDHLYAWFWPVGLKMMEFAAGTTVLS